jgi:type II secretory pathway pseudopilin PulG
MSARDRLIIMIVVAIAAVGAAWFFLVQPKRDQAAKLGTQLTSIQSQLESVRSELAAGQAARDEFGKSYALMAKLGEAIPADDNVPSLVWELQAAAKKSGVDFRSLSVNGGASSPTTASTVSSSSATQSATATLPPGATVGPAGLPIEPFTFTFEGNFFHLANFLGRVQRFVVANNKHVSVSGRLLTLNAISLGSAPEGFPRITATIAATTFLVPASQGVMAGATPTGPATSTPAQSVSTPGSSTSSPAPAAVATPLAK